ncbi:MAG: leucine dehydrogenase [Bdellovibrionaceae bacterium]|nr:leucine dehydrogenase [Pseudobdellovibrionaceae bacterium]|tara:strand:+ start:315 stop:1628 length:1314 start_codon:yes stop_codon:yes gene_type:complete
MAINWNTHPESLARELRALQINRFYFIYDPATKKVIPSHPELAEMAQALQADERDYAQHEGLFFQVSQNYDLIMSGNVHRTSRGQAAGGTRFWFYNRFEDFVRDGMRLSKGMTYKNALAGLWWGGGKGVISRPEGLDVRDPEVRKKIFQEYGSFITSLKGCYITAEDVGTNTTDIGSIFSKTRFVISIPEEVGGSGNPSAPTALGVVRGMEAAVEWKMKSSLEGKTIAIQGLGNVGRPMVRYLLERNVGKIIACDINPELVESMNQDFRETAFTARAVDRNDSSILFEECDVLAPCATGAILNPNTIPEIKAPIICGAANNQLEDSERDGPALLEKGVVYVPDYLVNRMGIVNCANEQYGYTPNDPYFNRHIGTEWENSVYQMTKKVLTQAEENQCSPAKAADELAEKLSHEEHPLFGHRAQLIVQSLRDTGWEQSL